MGDFDPYETYEKVELYDVLPLPAKGLKLFYLFDFGDSWYHAYPVDTYAPPSIEELQAVGDVGFSLILGISRLPLHLWATQSRTTVGCAGWKATSSICMFQPDRHGLNFIFFFLCLRVLVAETLLLIIASLQLDGARCDQDECHPRSWPLVSDGYP